MSSSKRQQTMAKRAREQAVREKRALKRQKKLAAKMAEAVESESAAPAAADEPAPQAD